MVGILGANSLSGGGYEISNSLRFNDDDSPFLGLTPGSAGNRRTFTLSVWFKLQSTTTTERVLLAADDGTGGNNNFDYIAVKPDSKILVYGYEGSENQHLISTQVLRDPSAWYHLVVAFDTTQGTASNRIKFYLNGSQITAFDTANYPSQNFQTRINNANKQRISSYPDQGGSYYDGYMAEYHLVDGQQLAPTDFGEFNDNGVWIPKAYEGTYGTNGFYLEFKQTGTGQNSSGIGADTSGNDNHWAVTNLTATDVTTDTPTNNFATLLPLATSSLITLSEGNVKSLGNSASDNGNTRSSIMPSSGKWYVEVKVGAIGSTNNPRYGIVNDEDAGRPLNGASTSVGQANPSMSWDNVGDQDADGSDTGVTLSTYTTGDIIGIALDCDNGALYMSKNGTYETSGDPTSGASKTGAIYTFTAGTGFAFGGSEYNSSSSEWNYGNPPYAVSSGNADGRGYGNFEYAVPSGYYSLCTKNLAEFG